MELSRHPQVLLPHDPLDRCQVGAFHQPREAVVWRRWWNRMFLKHLPVRCGAHEIGRGRPDRLLEIVGQQLADDGGRFRAAVLGRTAKGELGKLLGK
jgi:hypothetical protein